MRQKLVSHLIKKHKPKYNILLKDDKKYPYFLITDEDFPRIQIVRKKNLNPDKGHFYGPYTDIGAMHAKSDVERGIKFTTNREDSEGGKGEGSFWIHLCDKNENFDKSNYEFVSRVEGDNVNVYENDIGDKTILKLDAGIYSVFNKKGDILIKQENY